MELPGILDPTFIQVAHRGLVLFIVGLERPDLAHDGARRQHDRGGRACCSPIMATLLDTRIVELHLIIVGLVVGSAIGGSWPAGSR